MKKFTIMLLVLALSLSFASCDETKCSHEHLTSHVTAPTCDSEGFTLNTCVECKIEFKTDYIPPLGHNIIQTVFSPTCIDEGYTFYACACGYNYKSDILAPVGHTYNVTENAATCEGAGYTEYSCTVCEHTYKSNYIDAMGHTMESEITLPTPEEPGFTRYLCTVCNTSYCTDFVFYNDVYGGGEVENRKVLARGVDVSAYQHIPTAIEDVYLPLDWQALKNVGIDYAILKIGSKNGKDPVFEMNYADAKAAGMELGAYFYCYATTEEELENELALLLEWIDGKQFEYPIYFDIEDSSILANTTDRDTLTKLCMTFVSTMREHGYYGAVYCNAYWLDNFLYENVMREFCDIWYARYQSEENMTLENTFTWIDEVYGKQMGMWQYSRTAYIDGCGIMKNQAVDLNYCYKDYPTIIKTYGLNGFSANISTSEAV